MKCKIWTLVAALFAITGISCDSKNGLIVKKGSDDSSLDGEVLGIGTPTSAPAAALYANVVSAANRNLKGTIQFQNTPAGLGIRGTISGLTPNAKHGLHVHENAANAECINTFTEVGPHFNPGAALYAANCAKCHGAAPDARAANKTAAQVQEAINTRRAMASLKSLTPDAVAAIGAFLVGGHAHGHPSAGVAHAGDLGNLQSDANGVANLNIVRAGLTLEGASGVLNRALIIHAGEDDLKTQPTGNSGDRIGCAKVLARSATPPTVQKGPSGYPLCGSTYYGILFGCNGRTCAKSDPEYVNFCEVSLGRSGYPLCSTTYYGSVFGCNGRSCAKSDPQYKNICELTATSTPLAGYGVSGYPYCPTPRYGTDFGCAPNRTCSKSDPEFINICEVR